MRDCLKIFCCFYFFKDTRKLHKLSCFGRKTLDVLINTTLFQIHCNLVLNFLLNIKYKILLKEKPFVTPPLL